MQNTRDMIAEFQRAFGRPIHDVLQKNPSVSDRMLLGSILLEEVIETITLGLGLTINSANGIAADKGGSLLSVGHREGDFYDPIETADGLGDINVVIHFNAHWLGMNLDRITQEINDSNMSKLDEKGQPIINMCKHFGGDRMPDFGFGGEAIPEDTAQCMNRERTNDCDDSSHFFRPDLPKGKILKGPNFRKPDIAGVLGLSYGLHIDESDIKPSAQLDHCSEHPDQTTANCTGGYGLAGGGVGMYYICNTCGGIFGKTDDGDDFG